MIKKYKNILKYLTLSFVPLILIATIFNFVSAIWEPGNAENFISYNASSLLGVWISDSGYWAKLDRYGQIGCFYHVAGGIGMSKEINSVFDTGFDEERGVMKVDSIVRGIGSRTTLAYNSDTNTVYPKVGKLVAETSRTQNLYYVYTSLRQAMSDGTVLQEPAMTYVQEGWHMYGQRGVNVFNPAPEGEIDLYTNYKKLGKETTKETVEEMSEDVTINSKSYTIVGPFKMSFGGKNINKVTVGNAVWTTSSTNEIYWCTSKSTNTSDWSNDFNKRTSGQYILNNNKFYIAVDSSKLPADGNYKIKIEQEEFSYRKARIIVCTGSYKQQTGMYCYDNTPNTVKGEATWEAERTSKGKNLLIIKRDINGNKLTGAGFKIYAELDDGTKGWISGSIDAEKKYESDEKNATEYADDVKIEKLQFGSYYIFETKAPKDYDLADQRYYKRAPEGMKTPSGDWVYIGTQKIDAKSKPTINYSVLNVQLTKSLEIIKVDSKDSTELTGAKFKIYAVLDQALPDGTKEGWVTGSLSDKKEYSDNIDKAAEYESKQIIEKLRYGTYYIYETKAPEEYELKLQENYKKGKEGVPTPTGEWVYVGSQSLNTKTSKTVTYTVENKKEELVTTKIIKIDAKTEQKLTGGKFKIYAVIDDETKGWVVGNSNEKKKYEADASKATEYDSYINIEKLKSGKYYYFETKAPESYNIKKQNGYMKTDSEISNIRPNDSEYVYLGSEVIPKEVEENQVFEFEATNGKTVDKIEGRVWQDKPDTKANKTDGIYKEGTNDALLQDIKVTLYDNEGTAIAAATTDENGYYSFTKKNASTYTGEDKNLYFSELTKGYVEFTYDNSKYICVDVLVGDDVKVNSKAQEYTITKVQLDDNNIENKVQGAYPGKAVTDKFDKTITSYYDDKTYTISNINLGLMEKLEPEFTITEDVAYMKVKFGDYVYKYEYMKDSDQLTRTTVPTVNQQVSKRTFTAKIYPSDVAYESKAQDGTLKVYMVYRINVFNNTSHNIDNNYKEAKMYVESLMNSYNSKEYILNGTDKHNVDIEEASKDFGLWSENGVDENGNSLATYNCEDTWRNYKAGVKTEFDEEGKLIEGREGYVTSYIQFQLTESFVNKILEKTLTEEDLETAPSKATAKTFHEYWRKDQVWEESKDRYYEGNILEDAEMSKSYYLHKSKYQTESSADLAMKFALPEKERTLSGVVFEDKVENNDTKLGNGKKDDTENTVSKVTVDLMKSPNEIATLYPLTIKNGKYTYDGEKPATVEVEEGGTFEFKGVIPGIYYIRFTYGNGEQRLYDMKGHIVKVKDANGNDTNEDVKVTLNDYKSTIIDVANSEDAKIIKDAIENGTNLEWYKDLKEETYSTAIDDMAQRQKANGYVYYADSSIHNEDGSLVNDEEIQKSINSYTPKISVTIENDKEESRTSSSMIEEYSISQDENENVVEDIRQKEESPYYEFKGFNFGIITVPNTTITTSKTISNIKLTDQTGATLVSADPKDKNAKYVTALDGVGSNVKAEIEEKLLYGSEVEVTYNITLTNYSDIDFIENDSEHLGDWYNYGIKTDGVTEPKSVTIKEVEDILNEKYNSDSVKLVSYSVNKQPVEIGAIEINKAAGENAPEINETKTIEEDGTETTETKMLITGWSDQMKRGDTQTIEYTVNALLASDNEDEEGYTNDARVTKIKLNELTPLTSGSEWSKLSETVVSITPPTGQDKTSTYYIAGAIALIALASGIIIIKKRVLK